MQDLNDLYYFAAVVAHGGFAPAGRALRQPKSKLSRRVSQLEAALGVRLIERSSRRFRITEVGQAFYERCRGVLNEVELAQAVISDARSEPQGTVRFSCPIGLMEPVAGIVADFLARHPKVKLQIIVTNRPVDLIDERIDVALRVRTKLDTDAQLTMRSLARSQRILVASPAFANRLGEIQTIEMLSNLPTLSPTEQPGEDLWVLFGPDEATFSLRHEPRLSCGDFTALREAAQAGLGVALLPEHVIRQALHDGTLVRMFPGWHAEDGTVHLVFTTRRGLPPAVRALIDQLAQRFRDAPPMMGSGR